MPLKAAFRPSWTADSVAVGRPVLYGLALGGWQGAHSVLEHLREVLEISMMLAGTPNIRSITREYIYQSNVVA
jgi:lactate oxidase